MIETVEKQLAESMLIGSGKATDPKRAICSLLTLSFSRQVSTKSTTRRWRTERKRTNNVVSQLGFIESHWTTTADVDANHLSAGSSRT
jgi:hypothetical protein